MGTTKRPLATPPTPPSLRREKDGTLTFSPAGSGEAVRDCHVSRSFPWSLPFRYISIRNSEGEEQLLIPELPEAPAELRHIVEEELSAQELIPRITKIRNVDDTFDMVAWQVDTNSGAVEFQTRHDEDVRQLENNRIIFKDHCGMLFEIPALNDLDPESRAHIEERVG